MQNCSFECAVLLVRKGLARENQAAIMSKTTDGSERDDRFDIDAGNRMGPWEAI